MIALYLLVHVAIGDRTLPRVCSEKLAAVRFRALLHQLYERGLRVQLTAHTHPNPERTEIRLASLAVRVHDILRPLTCQ